MNNFDVQSIELKVNRDTAFNFIADSAQLPNWTNAFAKVEAGTSVMPTSAEDVKTYTNKAVMLTPAGKINIDLDTIVSEKTGSVDWYMNFPDGSQAAAFSRIVASGQEGCIYSFVLMPPPVPLEELEGALAAQSETLKEELSKLKEIIEFNGQTN